MPDPESPDPEPGTHAETERLREEAHTLDIINTVNSSLAAELDLDRLVQLVTDAGTELTGAEFGSFFYNVLDDRGASYMLYTLSGAPREAFAGFPMPRATAVFAPTFKGEGIMRLDDVTADPRYGREAPYYGMPKGHLPVRSYLAVPVISRSGEVLGGLFFGHSKAGVFTERAERIVVAVANQAAIALDNAKAYRAVENEVRQRKLAEEQLRLLLAELNHRVKNTLTTVLAIASQTLQTSTSLDGFAEAFRGRLHALAEAHTILTEANWEAAELRALIGRTLAPYERAEGGAIHLGEARVLLRPQAALTLGMVLHELATNAAKYGALSVPTGGAVRVGWEILPDRRLRLLWTESGGPAVQKPTRRGFGTNLINFSIAHQLQGDANIDYAADGLICEILIPLTPEVAIER